MICYSIIPGFDNASLSKKKQVLFVLFEEFLSI